MANNPNLPISTGDLNEYHQSVIGDLSQTGITGQTVASQLSVLSPTKTMTAKFDLSDSNPSTWGSYQDDAISMTVGSNAWDKFFGIKPVMLKNGAVVGELDPSQGYAKYTDGTSADITSGTDGDVMIYVPRRDIKIWSENGYGYVSITNELDKAGYTHYAHSYKGNDCDWFAFGRYKGYYDGSKLRSLSGKTPTAQQTLGTFRTYAQANGAGYEQNAFLQNVYIQAMYMLKYLGQNSQNVIGRGYINAHSGPTTTGGTNSHPMDWGENTGDYQMSLFGIEDYWGNLHEHVDGVFCNSSRKIFVADGNYDDAGTGYTDAGTSGFTSNVDGYLKDAVWSNICGFSINSKTYGSGSTYFCDGQAIYPNALGMRYGSYDADDRAGVFCLSPGGGSSSIAWATLGSRLMNLHVAS